MKTLLKLVLTAFVGAALGARAQSVIEIVKPTAHLIPISVSGFTGEADSVLKFDLAVLGMSITTPDKAEYQVTGKSEGRVEGGVTQTGMSNPIFLKAYSGATIRSQAHALADDIVKELRQTPPIFQGKISFRLQNGASTEIAVADFDGYNPVVVTHDGTLVGAACWLRGGRGLLYPSWKNGEPQVFEQNLTTGARRIFASYPGGNLSPEVSPDGHKVAMILSKGGSPNLYVCNSDGSGLKQLTSTRDDDSSPCWAPDSERICFTCRSGRAMLQVVNINGGAPTIVRAGGIYGNLTSPDWSPDGKQIAFTSGSGNFGICVVPAEGGEAERLVAGEDPCWAPNSRTIIFTRRVNHRRSLCLLDVPTKHVKDIRQISGSCSEPSWAR